MTLPRCALRTSQWLTCAHANRRARWSSRLAVVAAMLVT